MGGHGVRLFGEQGEARDSGASAVEYALIVTGIATAIILIAVSVGLVLNRSVTNSCDHIKQTLDSSASAQCVSAP